MKPLKTKKLKLNKQTLQSVQGGNFHRTTNRCHETWFSTCLLDPELRCSYQPACSLGETC